VHSATQRISCVFQQFVCYCALGPHTQRFVNFYLSPPTSPFSVNVMIRVVAGRRSSHGFPARAVFSFPHRPVWYQLDVDSDEHKAEAIFAEEWSWPLAPIYVWSLSSTATSAFVPPCLITHMHNFILHRVRCRGSFIFYS